MARYIDADALKDKWLEEMIRWSKQSDDYCDGSHWTDVYADFIKELVEAPTVDAEPVKHGHWINKEISPDAWVCLCSECDDVAYYSMHKVATKFRYCTNCGAKMDEEEDG